MKTVRLTAILLAALLLGGCAAAPFAAPETDLEKQSVVLFAMDTVMELTTYDGDGEAALVQASELIERLDGLLSTTNADSEVYAANHSAGKPVSLSDDTAQLLEQVLAMCRDTDGALDISIYPVVRTWGFTTGEYQVPQADVLSDLLEGVDYRRILLEDGLLTVPDGMEIDLGAVAKGYASDHILAIFRQAGVTSALINLGGNLHVLGTKTDGSLWRLAVQAPEGNGFAGVIETADKAVITSGGYERFFEEDGQRYWHIIDPDTGSPAQNGLISVTIISDTGVLGDALSTALFVMGREQAIAYWRGRTDFDFILIEEDGTVTVSEGIADSFSLYGDWVSHKLEVAYR